MKCIRLFDKNKLKLTDEPIPDPREGEVLIKVTHVGICGSDIHWVQNGSTGGEIIESPFIPGHEFAGVIANGNFKGTRVAVDPHIPCGKCEFCMEGNPNLCPFHIFAGQYPQDGAMREFIPWPFEMLHLIPDNISNPEAVMLEPLGVAIHAVKLGKIKKGMHIGVFGCGPIGLLIIQLAKLAGVKMIAASDYLEHRLKAARSLGATHVFKAEHGNESENILVSTKNRGLDVVFEVAGDNDAVKTSINTVKPGGRVILCGIPADNLTSFEASTARRKGLTIKLVRRMKFTYPYAIDLVNSGKVDVKSIISHIFPVEEYAQAFETACKRDGNKVIVQMCKSD